LLHGGLGVLPLAPISAVTEAELPGIIDEMEKRLDQRAARRRAETLWAATYVLLGLRHPPAFAQQLLQRVRSMKESSTYQAILAEGEARGEVKGALAEAKKLLRQMGEGHLGRPDAATEAILAGLHDLRHLEDLLRRLGSVTSWQDLLQPPRRRRGR
jgi:predicted transposase YdaD